eukprot:2906293-Pyramimonas_sp.AAC.1
MPKKSESGGGHTKNKQRVLPFQGGPKTAHRPSRGPRGSPRGFQEAPTRLPRAPQEANNNP